MTSAEYPAVSERGVATKKQKALFVREGRTPQQEAEAVAAQMRPRAAYREEMCGRMATGLRRGNQRVVVGADEMKAMYVVGMRKGRQTIGDLKALVKDILPLKRVFHFRFMHWDKVEFLVNEDDYAEIARVLTDCCLKIREEYSPEGTMAKKTLSETDKQWRERNAKFAYRAVVRFPRELKNPVAVKEFYARILRKLERNFPQVYNPAMLGGEEDWDLSRRESAERAQARERVLGRERMGVREGGKIGGR